MNLYRIETSVMTLHITAGSIEVAIRKAKRALRGRLATAGNGLTKDEQRILLIHDKGEIDG